MRTDALIFEQMWDAHVQGSEPAVHEPRLADLVAVAAGVRSLRDAGTPDPVERAWARLSVELDRPVVPLPTRTESAVLRPGRTRRRLAIRLAAAALAVFAAVASASLRAEPGSFLYPLRNGLERTALFFDSSLHLRLAQARLDDLVHVLSDGPQDAAPGVALALVEQRSASLRDGQDVDALDASIRTEVPPALAGVPRGIAGRVVSTLGSLLPPGIFTTPPETSSGPPGTGVNPTGPGVGGSSGTGEDSGGGSGSSDQGGGGGGGSGDSGSGDTGSGDTGSGDGGSGDTGSGGTGSGDVGSGGTGSGDVGSGGTGSGDGGSGGTGSGDGGSGTGSDGGSGGTDLSGSGDGGSGDSSSGGGTGGTGGD